jgi:hypothetical protein
LARRAKGATDLLWVPHAPALAEAQLLLRSADDRRLAVTVGGLPAAAKIDSAHMLRFWPDDIDDVPQAASFAADYQQPAQLRLTAGNVLRDVPGDLNGDGFNECEGCYELSAADGVLRLTLDPGGLLRHEPLFRVHGTAGQHCWVYVEGRIVQSPGRDGQDRLMFVLPGVVKAPVSIEVNSRPR